MEKMIILKVDRPVSDSPARTPVATGAGLGVRGARPTRGSSGGDGLETLADMKMETAELNDREQSELSRDPNVAASSRAMPIKLIQPTARSDDPQPAADGDAAPTWGVAATGATSENFIGIGTKVAVLDTGIDKEHPAFAGIPIQDDVNYRDFTGEGFNDDDGHGTHCAGTIFGRDVDGHRIGVAKGVSEILIGKVLGVNGGDTAALVHALDWAIANQANIISMSLGYDVPGLVQSVIERTGLNQQAAFGFGLTVFHQNLEVFNAMMAKIEAIAAIPGFGEGAIVTAASGNESNAGQDARHRLPASLPSASKGVISVGALREADNDRFAVADFSNGDVRIAAPGVNVLSARSGGGLVAWDGTSMATPHVAGLLARLYQKQKQNGDAALTDRVIAELIATADPSRIDANAQTEYGAGIAQSP
ncbi:MAG: S8 family serine peptidase [Pseudomonadota bacterium]